MSGSRFSSQSDWLVLLEPLHSWGVIWYRGCQALTRASS